MKTPKSRSRKQAPTLPGIKEVGRPTVVWFARNGCVVREGERRSVVIAGRRVGSWEPGERGIRNALMVELADDPSMVFEDLARAFEVSSETLRLQRKLYQEEGLEAVLKRGEPHHKGGRKLAPAVRRKLDRLFAQGRATAEVVAALKGVVHRSTVDKYRRHWESTRAQRGTPAQQTVLPLQSPATSPQAAVAPSAPQQGPVVAASEPSSGSSVEPDAPVASHPEPGVPSTAGVGEPGGEPPPIRAPRSETSEYTARVEPLARPAPSENQGASEKIAEFAPFSANGVQHAGAWLLLLTVASFGFYAYLRSHERRRPEGRPLRVAVDVVFSALAIGGRCVESVRRLATRSIAALMLADAAPSATWVRRTLGGYCAGGTSEKLLKDVSGELLRRAKQRTPHGKPVVLFIDNHGLPYTGKHKLRRIWRMQDKCTVPGAMEYWLHDVEGRPVLVVPTAPNVSLPQTIRESAAFLREKLGKDTPLLLVFDRAGAFPGLWKWLRDNGIQFVTYQRSSYRKFCREWFGRHGRPMNLRDADGEKVKVLVQAGRMNLGARRGRVRRIRILMPDDVQMNVVAWSSQPDKWLCQTLFTRWRQENALKHGVERWGLNQLDGRQVEDVPAGTMVTNPQRTKLDRLLRDKREQEKKLRLQLQQLYPGHPERRELKRALDSNCAAQRALVEARRQMPRKVPIERTELNGELKQHKREYKLLADTLRCVGQNAEAELAAGLAANLPRPEEAKRLLQNVFGASGNIHVSAKAITVSLDPAANAPERAALKAFFSDVNRRRLCHPGDPFTRPVRFRLQMP